MIIIADNPVVKVIDFEPAERTMGKYVFFFTSVYPEGRTIPSYLRIFKDRLEMEVLEFVKVKGTHTSRAKVRKMEIDFVDLFEVNQLIKRVSDGGRDIYVLMSEMYDAFEKISKKEEKKHE